jgi:hypothetical protein
MRPGGPLDRLVIEQRPAGAVCRTAGRKPARLARAAGSVSTAVGCWELVFMLDYAINYVESDLPAEVTLAQWRRARAAAFPRRRLSLRTFVPARRRPALAV